MLTVAFLLLAQAAAADAPVLKGDLKDVPAQGKTGPALQLDVATNLPDGALVDVSVYYDRVNEGREISKFVATVKGGKFSQDFQPFPSSTKNLAGRYVALLRFNTALQNIAIGGFADSRSEIQVRIGTPGEFEVEAKAFRARLSADLQEIVALGDQVKAKIDALKGKPAEEWKPLLKEWTEKAVQIQARALKVPEYNVLGLDLIANSGLENLTGILNSAARTAAAGQGVVALEGLTRLRQTAEYWMGEINTPRLHSPVEIVQLIDAARKLIGDALRRPDGPVLPLRRKFVEMNAVLQKSLPEDFQPLVLEIGTRAAAFFNAVSDKEPNAKDLHAELDKTLEKLAAPLRPVK